MPPAIILSPYSGRPVKIREQDLGRALRDEQGRVFYVVEDPEHGRYAARTRKGSPKDLERYRAIEANTAQLDDEVQTTRQGLAQAHDASGAKRRNPLGLLVLVLLLAAVAALGYVYLNHPEWLGLGTPDRETPDDADAALDVSTTHTPHIVHASTTPAATIARPAPRAIDPQPIFVDTQPRQTNYEDFRHTASGLRYKITHLTDGPHARAGNYITVRYTAQTLDGKPLINDASQSFILASGQAIRAFDEGLAGIREGEQLRLLVPRGHSDQGSLPGIKRIPDEPFLMDVQLVSVRPGVTHITETPGDINRQPCMPGDTIYLNYIARIEGQDEVIDATVHRGEPMRITLGNNEVIQGLELGITGMRPGEARQLSIPPYLAYGKHSVAGGLIPENAVLNFRVSLVGIVDEDE